MVNFIGQLLGCETMYDWTQLMLFVTLVIVTTSFLGISYWFEFLEMYRKHHHIEKSDKVLTHRFHRRVVRLCHIDNPEYSRMLEKVISVAFDEETKKR